MNSFKEQFSETERQEESSRIRKKYPNRIPIVIYPIENPTLPVIDKNKFLVPDDVTVAHFIKIIRDRIKLKPEQAMFIFLTKNGGSSVIPPTSALIGAMYQEHKSDDGFLYVQYSGENTFGSDKNET